MRSLLSSSLVAAGLLAAAATTLCTATVRAQYTGPSPEFSTNNFFRVVSNAKHGTTNRNYPAGGTTPPGYTATTGVPAKTRYWQYTPPLRSQGGGDGKVDWTVVGMTQAIFVGAAVNQFPAPNHYQFKGGVAPAVKGGSGLQKIHDPNSTTDVFSVASQAIAINAGGIYEHNFTLTTPVQLKLDTDMMLFVEYRGGEYREDPNGGQTLACDWKGNLGPGRLAFAGFAGPTIPRSNTWQWSVYRPKIGLLVQQAAFAATGHHANFYETPKLVNEKYTGLSACVAQYHKEPQSDLFFDIRAGAKYSSGTAVVLMNVNKLWFPSRIPLPWGSLMLNPGDPALTLLTSNALLMQQNGVHNGEATPILVPQLGSAALDTYLKFQAVVFNSGFQDVQVTNSSSIIVHK